MHTHTQSNHLPEPPSVEVITSQHRVVFARHQLLWEKKRQDVHQGSMHTDSYAYSTTRNMTAYPSVQSFYSPSQNNQSLHPYVCNCPPYSPIVLHDLCLCAHLGGQGGRMWRITYCSGECKSQTGVGYICTATKAKLGMQYILYALIFTNAWNYMSTGT